MECVDLENLDGVSVKSLYTEFTATLPPPKVEYKYDMPWDDIYANYNHPVLGVHARELMFMLVHNILPTKDRLHKLNQVDNPQCQVQDGVESTVHAFCLCARVQEAWAWMRRKIHTNGLALPGASDFDLIHLNSGLRNKRCDFVWLISHYIGYVWNLRKTRANYRVNIDVLKIYLEMELMKNQTCQNKVSPGILR